MPVSQNQQILVTLAADKLENLEQQRDEARAELQELKARLESSLTKELVALIRPEPSRLEIAAMFMAATWVEGPISSAADVLKTADRLIAAARQ